jgi:hypothetical protein
MSAIGAAGLATVMWLMAPPPADHLTVLQAFELFGIMYGLSLVFMPFVIIGGYKSAANQMSYVQKASAFALENFDRLAEGSDESKVITRESLTKLLRDSTVADEDLELISYLRDNLDAFGHKIGEEHYFVVQVDTKIEKREHRATIFAANRTEVQQWPSKVADHRRTWLRFAK